MSDLIVCPPQSPRMLDPDWIVPHPGFGITSLFRNGQMVWESVHGEWYDFDPKWTVAELTEWCPVRQGVGWKLVVYGPMVTQAYRLIAGSWVLVGEEMGFA